MEIQKKAKQLSLKSMDAEIQSKAEASDERLKTVEGDIGALKESLDSGFKELTTLMESFTSLAKNNVRTSTKGIDSRDVYEHDDETGIEFEKNKDPMADVEVVKHAFGSVNSPEFIAKIDQMKFDEEQIEIMVMPSQSHYPDHTFTIGVNGRLRVIVRGTKQWMPRKYVEVLLRAKISSYGNFERRNEYNGELEIVNAETKSHRYPLQILTDKNPKGHAWLVRVTNDTGA